MPPEESAASPPQRRCETVGETTSYLFISIPPNQSRDLDEYVSFSSLGQPRGEYVWHHEVVWLKGRE